MERSISPEWCNDIVSKALGHTSLRPWQISAIMSLISGKDVFVVAPTGAGKSAVMLGAVLADMARGIKSIGITVVPTKSLADDQARAINKLNITGLKALALHEDTLQEANTKRPRQDLFREIQDGVYSHIFLGPEMIMSAGFDQILKNTKFCEWFRYFAIDEVHTTVEWSEFRDTFADLHRLRNRFKALVVWVALTATVEPTREFPSLATSVGFDLTPGATTIIRLPVDRPKISYSPRFLKYGASDDQSDFPDLAYLVPRSLRNIIDIPITVVFAGRIKQVSRIAKYLRRLLPADLEPSTRSEAIIPFNGTLSALHNGGAIEKLRLGDKTRILVCTSSGALGINIQEVERVVILVEKDANFRMICQKMGRIRTSGQAIIHFQRWMSTARTAIGDVTRRNDVEPVIVDFANATINRCPRMINVEYWGDAHAQHLDGASEAVPSAICCNKHNPELDAADLAEVEGRVKEEKAEKLARDPLLRSDGTHRVPDNLVMRPIARDLVETWRQQTLEDIIGYEPYLPFSAVLPDHLIDVLIEKLHVCSTFDRFRLIMRGWSRLDELGDSLYKLVVQIWETYESEEGSRLIKEIIAHRQSPEETDMPNRAAEGQEATQESHVTGAALPVQGPSTNRRSNLKPKSSQARGTQKKKRKVSNK